jgi:protein SCO1/2
MNVLRMKTSADVLTCGRADVLRWGRGDGQRCAVRREGNRGELAPWSSRIHSRPNVRTSERPNVRTSERPNVRTPARPHVASLISLTIILAAPTVSVAETNRTAILSEVGIDQRLNEQVPLDLVFRDETGAPVELERYFGKRPVILTLVYYECPMLCTLVLNGLLSALRTLTFDVGKQFDVVTVSFDPDEKPDLAAKKKENVLAGYRREGAEAGWHFLTGDADAIRRLASAVGFRYQRDPGSGEFAHAAAIMVLTPQGKLARYFYGVEYAPRDLRLGLIEAAEGRIGNAVDQVLLYCYRYDPHTGRYSAAVMNLVRAGGLVTVLGLGAFMFVLWRRDARNDEGGKA